MSSIAGETKGKREETSRRWDPEENVFPRGGGQVKTLSDAAGTSSLLSPSSIIHRFPFPVMIFRCPRLSRADSRCRGK